jgi:YD repeat-containing protein
MTTPYQGGQCQGTTYTVTLVATNFNTRFGPCGQTYQAIAGVTGPVYGLDNYQGFVTVSAANGSNFTSPSISNDASKGCADYFTLAVHGTDAAIISIVRADGQPDNCGNVPSPPPEHPCNPAPGEPACPVTTPASSDFDVHSGAVTEQVDLVTYQSLGEPRGLSLRYSSLTADPRPILHFRYSQVFNPYQTLIGRLTIQRGSYTYRVPGYPRAEYGLVGSENFWSVPTINTSGYKNGVIDAALQADLRDQPSGEYTYSWQRSIQYIDATNPQFTALGAAETGSFIHVNRVNSPFGAGWALADWQEIITNPNGNLILLDGDGTQLRFGPPASAGAPYSSPAGDFSRLEKLADNTYRRTLPDRTLYTFNAQGKLTGIKDRNNNLTQYVYNGTGQLTQIIDPVNFTTTFTYTGTRITQITDPANRITKLEYNATGDLIKLTHPDNAVWQWEYQSHRMSASIDPRNNRASIRYDSFGRATEATRRDGSIVKIEPVAVKGLSVASQTSSFQAPPPAYRWPDAQANSPIVTYTDGNGRKLSIQVDRRGSAVSYTDEIGPIQSIQYNAQNLVQTQTNGRGQPTNYSYNSQGNVTQVTDTLSGANGRRYSYDATFNQLASVTDELGRQTLYDIDPANGNVRAMTQAVGTVGGTDDQITRYTYTSRGLVNTITDALNRVTAFTYSTAGRRTKVTLAQGTADESVLNYTYVFTSGVLATVTDARGNVTKFFYDAFNRLIRVEEPDPDGTGAQTGPITRLRCQWQPHPG